MTVLRLGRRGGPDRREARLLRDAAEERRRMASWTDRALAEATGDAGPALALALAQEAALRGLDMDPGEQQVLAAIRVHRGNIVEFPSGEGKTLVVSLASAMHVIAGRRVHVMTANDYLADRDRWWMAPMYRILGISVGAVLDHMYAGERRGQYRRDVVYGTLREFAFDEMRDRMADAGAGSGELPLQGRPDVGIVDEADEALLDEAATPLVIAGEAALNSRAIRRADRAVRALASRQVEAAEEARRELSLVSNWRSAGAATALARAMMADPDHEETLAAAAAHPSTRRRAAAYWENGQGSGPDERVTAGLPCAIHQERAHYTLLPDGVHIIEEKLGPVYENAAGDGRRSAVLHHVHQLITAHLLLRRDEDYIVADGRVVLLDRATGRPRTETRYRYGLQPAVEAKEGLEIHADAMTRAATSVPCFVRRYRTTAGITATARAGESEFRSLYGLPVSTVEPASPSLRLDRGTRVYAGNAERMAAMVDEVKEAQGLMRPVLVATRSVAGSHEVSDALTGAGVDHSILNATTGLAEEAVISTAGAPGMVTVVTNMAGRGTDIVPEPGLDEVVLDAVRRLAAERGGLRVSTARSDLRERVAEALSEQGWEPRRQGNGVLSVGEPGQHAGVRFGLGLLVITSEFNPCERVDAQIRGRTGRQGEHGETVSILSRHDPLLAGLVCGRASADRWGRWCWQGADLERRLRELRRSDAADLRARRGVTLEYASVSDAQTRRYHDLRRDLAEGDTGPRVAAAAERAATTMVDRYFPGLSPEGYEERFDALACDVASGYGVDAEPLWGESLDALSASLGALLAEQATAAGAAPRRDVVLPMADSLWENHIEDLWNRAAISQLDHHGLKTAVAEYIIAAERSWEEFVSAVDDGLLRHLCATPEETTAEPDLRIQEITELLAIAA